MTRKSSKPEFPLIDSLAGEHVLGVIRDVDSALAKTAHRHPHGELFFLHGGYLRSQTDDGHWLIPPGQICWIPPNVMHGADEGQMKWTRLHLSEAFCERLPDSPRVLTCTPLMRAVIDRLAEGPSRRLLLTQSEERLVQVLLDELEAATNSAILLPMPKDPRLASMAAKWISRPEDSADLDELASRLHTSRRSLTRDFKLETGLSIGQWRQIARFMRAVEMLANGHSVTDTALSLGYDSVSSFVLLCQRHAGMSPKSLARYLQPDV